MIYFNFKQQLVIYKHCHLRLLDLVSSLELMTQGGYLALSVLLGSPTTGHCFPKSSCNLTLTFFPRIFLVGRDSNPVVDSTKYCSF